MSERLIAEEGSPKRYDVFLSHNSRDKATVERIAEKLARAGLEPWLDKWCLAPGGRWQEELAEGLAASSACAVFIGPTDVGAWEREELGVALDRAAKDRSFRLFLVLLPGLAEPFEASALSPFLSTRTWVDFRRGLGDARALQALVNATKGIPLGPEIPIEPREDVSPYRGLRAFDEAHAEFFFGRDADVQRLLEKLKATSFLAVLGPSGSGKSSLARAGLVPALRRGALPGSEDWTVVVFRPGAHPLDTVVAHLVHLYPELAAATVRDQLAADPRTLRLLCSRPPTGGARAFFLVDQCEEVFTLCRDDEERRLFLLNLLHAAAAEAPSTVVLTLRADFYPRCAAYPELAQQLAAHQFLVGPMGEEGLRQAIEEPARMVGLELEAGLVETILEDFEHQPGALPLLEHALLELWERRRGRMLTLEAYRESGGVEGALSKRADVIFVSFAPHQQEIVRRVLLRLTQPGEGAEDTRRRVPMSELVTLPEAGEAVEAVVRILADARLVTTGGDEEAGERLIEVSHEALIRGWPQLRRWVEEDRQSLRIHRRLTEAAGEWQSLGRDPGALYRGARLLATREWADEHEADLNDLEREFVAASEALVMRERRKARRRLLALAGVLALGVLALTAVALVAFEQRNTAREERARAESRELAVRANADISARPERSLALAIEAMSRAETGEAEAALRRALLESHGRVVLRGHRGPVYSAAFGRDRSRILSFGDDNSARVWDAWSGDLIATLDAGRVTSAAFSPDRTVIVTTASDGSVRLWDPRSLRELRSIRAHKEVAHSATLSPDGKYLITVGIDEEGETPFDPRTTARVWEAASGRQVMVLRGHGGGTKGAMFSPLAGVLATGGHDGTVEIWTVGRKHPLKVLAGFPPGSDIGGTVDLLAFSPDGGFLAADAHGDVQVWETETWRGAYRVRGVEGEIATAAFSPDSEMLVTASGETAALWEAASGKQVGSLRGHTASISDVDISPDGSLVVTAATDGTARVWDAYSGEEVAILRGHEEGRVWSAEFGPDSRSVVTTGADGTARVWRVDVAVFRGSEVPVDAAEVSPDGKLILTTTARTVRVWEATGRMLSLVRAFGEGINAAFSPDATKIVTGEEFESGVIRDARSGRALATLKGASVSSAVFSPDGLIVAGVGDDGVAGLWDAETGRHLVSLSGHEHNVYTATFSPDGKLVATSSGDGTARVWDAGTGQSAHVLRGGAGDFSSPAFSRDGMQLLTVGFDGAARIWETSTGTRLAVLRANADAASFSPDGRFVLTWGEFSQPAIWETSTGRRVSFLSGHEGGVRQASFAPNGDLIATAGKDGTTRLWRAPSGEELGILARHQGAARAVAFSADGRFIVTGGNSGAVRVYPCEICAPINELLALARQRLQAQ